ncbi:MAG: hypothetical protein ACTSXV_01825, partial [Alphaproteobacteria bacterium]
HEKKFNETELEGLVTHELAHFEIYQQRGWIKTLFFEIVYWISPNRRKKEEEQTDKLAIKRGYAKEIYAIAKKLNKKKIRKHYMSPKEIKSYAEWIKKW